MTKPGIEVRIHEHDVLSFCAPGFPLSVNSPRVCEGEAPGFELEAQESGVGQAGEPVQEPTVFLPA
jgi:hypothetical protein